MSYWQVVFIPTGMLAITASDVYAASLTTSNLPGTVSPGRIEKHFELESPTKLEQSTSEVEHQDAGLEHGISGPNFTLRNLTLEGNTAFDAAQLEAYYHSLIGQNVDLSDIKEVALLITQHYRNAGYILSKAILPPQRVRDGNVKIQIIEGFVDEVVYEGAETLDKTQLAMYGEMIKRQRPLNNSQLERYLLLMDDLSGVIARGILSPSDHTVGASKLTVMLEHNSFDGNLFTNNRGSRFLGPLQFGGMVGFNSLLGVSERIQIRGITSANLSELNYYEATYKQPVGSDGLSLNISASLTNTEPGASLEPLNVEGDSVNFSFGVEYPWIRTRRENLLLSAGFLYRDSSSDILGVNQYDDQLRVFSGGIAYDTIDGWEGINRLGVNLSKGLGALGASGGGINRSRSDADGSFTKMEFSASRLQPLDRYFSVHASLSGQYAFDPLLASEEFGVGSTPFGSAYDSGEITGDSGVGARLELRYTDNADLSWMEVFQLYGFYDGGKVWDRNALPGESINQSITSTGAGVRFNAPYQLSGTLELAAPLTKEVTSEGSDGDDMRVFFSLNYNF